MSEIPKKILIPIIVAAILIICLIGGLVYRSTSSSPFKEEEVQQTIAPTTQAVIETKVASNTTNSSLSPDEYVPETGIAKEIVVDENGDILSEEEVASLEASEAAEWEALIESSSVEASIEASIEAENPTEETSTRSEEELQAEYKAVDEYQYQLDQHIQDAVHEDTLNTAREIAKAQVKKYASQYPELMR